MHDQPALARSRRAHGPGGIGWRLPFDWLSPAGPSAKLVVTMFHRVHRDIDPLFPGEMDAARFRTRLGWLREWFHVLPLEEAVAALSRGTLPARALAITFDDGYADNAGVALPILRELGLPATFFIATGFLDGGRMWNDAVIEAVRGAPGERLDLSSAGLGIFSIETMEARRATIDAVLRAIKHLPTGERQARVDAVVGIAGAGSRNALMMTSEEVRNLAAAGMGIGAHTVSHPILASIDESTARREIGESREMLEGLTGRPVPLFAYPNGKPHADYRVRDVALVRSLGFAAAVSTASGVARHGDSLYELPRFTPWDRTRLRWAARLLRNYLTPVVRAGAG